MAQFIRYYVFYPDGMLNIIGKHIISELLIIVLIVLTECIIHYYLSRHCIIIFQRIITIVGLTYSFERATQSTWNMFRKTMLADKSINYKLRIINNIFFYKCAHCQTEKLNKWQELYCQSFRQKINTFCERRFRLKLYQSLSSIKMLPFWTVLIYISSHTYLST